MSEAKFITPSQFEKISIVAVSKKHTIEKIEKIIHQGFYRLGENYLQEALPKILYFKHQLNLPLLEWHYIGRLQSNKIKKIAQYFDWVQSVDREEFSEKLNFYRDASLPKLNICIQLTETDLKFSELERQVKFISALPRLKLRGLMTMVTNDYQKAAEAYAKLKQHGYDIDTLSMGMSQDYLQAIKCGATMLRLGTIIFGERK